MGIGVFSGSVLANEENASRVVASVPVGSIVDGDYFAAAPLVEILGSVNGDVYAFGGQILIGGEIHGELLALGGVISISGTVSQDARVQEDRCR